MHFKYEQMNNLRNVLLSSGFLSYENLTFSVGVVNNLVFILDTSKSPSENRTDPLSWDDVIVEIVTFCNITEQSNKIPTYTIAKQ